MSARRVLLLSVLLAGVLAAQEKEAGLFERGVATLLRTCPPEVAPRSRLEALAARWRARLPGDATDDAQRTALFAFLGEIETSHLGLYSRRGADRVQAVLRGVAVPSFGLELAGLDDGLFVLDVLEGGPADDAGIVRGDRVTAIDGVEAFRSPRLDWRSDDAHLPDWPRHFLNGEPGDEVEMAVEREPGVARTVRISCVDHAPRAADRAAARIVAHGGHRLGILRLRYMYTHGAVELVRDALLGPLREADGLLLDLRGRGGSAMALHRIAALLQGERAIWSRPIVVLVDRNTRSAKEILAWLLQRSGRARVVGEHTAGAVRPAHFVPIGEDAALLVPVRSEMEAIEVLELRGLEPDRTVGDPLAWAAGADPIREAGLAELAGLCPF